MRARWFPGLCARASVFAYVSHDKNGLDAATVAPLTLVRMSRCGRGLPFEAKHSETRLQEPLAAGPHRWDFPGYENGDEGWMTMDDCDPLERMLPAASGDGPISSPESTLR